ncbi:MAG: phage tail assembly chaperone [Hyphomonadaceae bacterium]|nr:phage tail assembly chaperone [Hyphomonadaceae bacterium]
MLPWAEMLQMAVARGLAPDAFWKLSVREWLWLTTSPKPDFDAAILKSLMEAHPDG